MTSHRKAAAKKASAEAAPSVQEATRSFPTVRQSEFGECGPACLVAMATFYNRAAAPEIQKRLLGFARPRGTTLFDLARLATALGFVTSAWHTTDPNDLRVIPLPAIIHLSPWHFVVAVRCGESTLEIMDPGAGDFVELPLETIGKVWTGNILEVRASPR
jgi:ATP-binding cassette subfamily B protein